MLKLVRFLVSFPDHLRSESKLKLSNTHTVSSQWPLMGFRQAGARPFRYTCPDTVVPVRNALLKSVSQMSHQPPWIFQYEAAWLPSLRLLQVKLSQKM